MVNEFKVHDKVAHEDRGNGVVIGFKRNIFGECWPVVEYESGDTSISAPSLLRPRNFLNEFAFVVDNNEFVSWPYYIGLDDGRSCWTDASSLRPRNFLSKIAEEQEEKEGLSDEAKALIDKLNANWAFKTVDQQFNEVFVTDKYGIKRDPVTLLEIESDGIVAIKSIKETIREIG